MNKYLEKIAGLPINQASSKQIAVGFINKINKLSDPARVKELVNKSEHNIKAQLTSPGRYSSVALKMRGDRGNSTAVKKVSDAFKV